jgi:hypothetical protein
MRNTVRPQIAPMKAFSTNRTQIMPGCGEGMGAGIIARSSG